MLKAIVFAGALLFAASQSPFDLSGLLNGGSSGTPDGPPAISTTIADAYRQAAVLDDFSPSRVRPLEDLSRTTDGSYVLAPGAYASSLDAFCLDLGAHAPGTDAAYLLAPLKGPQGPQIQSILQRAYAHPEITRDDVQMLVWSVTSHVNLANLAGSLQQLSRTLLSSSDQASVNGASTPVAPRAFLNMILGQLPPDVRASFESLQNSRGALASGSNSYAQVAGALEKSAPASNAGVPRARWTYLAPGYFARVQAHSYKSADLQLYVPEGWTIQRDASGRLGSLKSKLGSSLVLTYGSSGTTLRVIEPFGTVPGLVNQGESVVNFSGTERDDAKALKALVAAIASSPAQSPGWNGLHDAAAEDTSKAQAELACRTMPCDVGKQGTKPVAFSASSVIAAPSDSSLQPLAVAPRPADRPVDEPPPTDLCKPGHSGLIDPVTNTVIDPIPAECLANRPRRATECELVDEQIHAQEFAQSVFKDETNLKKWEGLPLGSFVDQSQEAEKKAVRDGMDTLYPQPDYVPQGGDRDRQPEILGDTDMYTCEPSERANAANLLPVERQGIRAHEAEHVATCQAWKAQRDQAAQDRSGAVHPDPNTPRSRAADEVRAYDAGLKVLRQWYAANCGKK